ncbi:MAG TPA: hypothetical protein PLH36_12675, partial [Armatimonadota bacterium]|nr:hypothetical protein [Armatimonadota bacterium]
LARWVPSKQDYRYWPQHPEAGFYPPPDDPQNPSFALSTRPAGLGFWIKLSTDTPVRVNGDQIEDVAVRIPLSAGWNMIGSPFPFPVDWNGCRVDQWHPLHLRARRLHLGECARRAAEAVGRLLGQGEGQLLAASAAGGFGRDWPG